MWHVVQLSSRALWVPRRLADRLDLSTGSVRVVDPLDPEWEPGAVVPTSDWRALRTRPSQRELRRFRTERDVALVPLPPTVRRMAPERQVESLGKVDQHLGVAKSAPDRLTLTIDPATHLRIGLHLDNWDRLPTARRHTSRNRANVNVGEIDRAFLFLDLDVVSGHPADAVPDTRSARRRLRDLAPPPPLLRLAVPPGWAYIAPTETVLHDGSSMGAPDMAQHASALGRFDPVPGITEATVATVA